MQRFPRIRPTQTLATIMLFQLLMRILTYLCAFYIFILFLCNSLALFFSENKQTIPFRGVLLGGWLQTAISFEILGGFLAAAKSPIEEKIFFITYLN